jgi:hypothetical protein
MSTGSLAPKPVPLTVVFDLGGPLVGLTVTIG